MKKSLLALVAFLFATHNTPVYSQSDPVVIEVGGQQIRQSEFMQDFLRTTGESLAARQNMTAAEKKRAVEEYVDLYANFRAKVLDARSMGLDTAAELRRELASYRKELAAPYLIDSAEMSRILREAYDRNRYAIHAAHILVKVAPNASPEDTLAAYNRALELRGRVDAGENFTALAIEEAVRTNPQARAQENEGEISYFSAFSMVYPFENAAYAMKIGEVSQPVRTRYGYHIIKIIDRVEYYGKTTFQHIWKRKSNNSGEIKMIYEQLQSGMPFEMAARQSDDHSTAGKGGLIENATISQLPHEYVKKFSTMREGEVSAPFLTRYGWHIVKLVKRETLPPFENMVPYYKQKLVRDQRGEASQKAFVESCRKRYGIIDYTTVPKPVKKGKKKQPVEMMASLDEMVSLMTDSVFRDLWRYKPASIQDRRTLVQMPNKDYNALDLAMYIRLHQKPEKQVPFDQYVRNRYQNFIDSVTLAYTDSQLEKEHPEFASMVDDYRNGLMIFSYNDKMIWSKAIHDSAGFAGFYARESKNKRMDNPDDSVYFWRTRARVVSLRVADSACLEPAKALKVAQKCQQKGMKSMEMKEALLRKVSRKKCAAADPVTHTLASVEQTRQTLLADDQWKVGVYFRPESKGYSILVVEDIIEPCLKSQMEARGYYLNAWQNEVERSLMEELRAKYNVKIHRDVVGKITF